MNLRTQLFILGFMLFLIIVISLYSSTEPVPYSKDKLFSKEFPYEGMSPMSPMSSDETSMADNYKNENKKNNNSDSVVPVEGFQGLQATPYGSEQPLDKFSQLTGSKTCSPSPYSNSQGYLCLDKDTSLLLSTRGQNATGGDGTIGTPTK